MNRPTTSLRPDPHAARRRPEAGAVLVVDDHANARASLADILGQLGCVVECCASAGEAQTALTSRAFDLVITDLQMPGRSGLDLLKWLAARRDDTPTIVVTAHGTVAAAVDAMRHGALDFLEKPYRVDQLEEVVRRALAPAAGRASVPDAADDALAALLGASPAIERLRTQIARVGPTPETVLICGESGVGKELVARALHAASGRLGRPLVSVNCPALAPQLMESELFGHSRGAFTSADAARVGRFELADGGTLLLDEVTEIDLPLQAKLLRVLQEMAFEPVGSSDTRQVDVRVLAATNRELRDYVEQGRFREDLYFRLAVVPIQVPPLRERGDDALLLAEHFLAHAAARIGGAPKVLDVDARKLLTSYHWPGNVRELENLMTRASVLLPGETITADELRPWLLGATETPATSRTREGDEAASLHDIERRTIEATLERFGGHREKTAEALGIGVRTLTNKLRSYGYAPRTKAFARSA